MFSSFKSKFIWWWNYSSVILEMGRAALKFKIFFDKSKFCRNFFCLLVLASSHHELALFSSCASALLTNHLLALFFSEPLPRLTAQTTITQTVFLTFEISQTRMEWCEIRTTCLLANMHVLYISTRVWVLCNLNASPNMLFHCFSCKKAEKERKSLKKFKPYLCPKMYLCAKKASKIIVPPK